MLYSHPSMVNICGNRVLTYDQSDLKYYFDISKISKKLSDFIYQSMIKKKLHVTKNNILGLTLNPDELSKYISDQEILEKIPQLIFSNKRDFYELHKIEKEPYPSNFVRVTSYIFSNIKYNRLISWFPINIKFGKPYINLVISNKRISSNVNIM